MESKKRIVLFTLLAFLLSLNLLYSQTAYQAVKFEHNAGIYSKIHKSVEASDIVVEAEVLGFNINVLPNGREVLNTQYRVYSVVKGNVPSTTIETVFDTEEYISSILSSQPLGACNHGVFDSPIKLVRPIIGTILVLFIDEQNGNLKPILNTPELVYIIQEGCELYSGNEINYSCVSSVKHKGRTIADSKEVIQDLLKKKLTEKNNFTLDPPVIFSFSSRVPAGVDSLLIISGEGFGAVAGGIKFEKTDPRFFGFDGVQL